MAKRKTTAAVEAAPEVNEELSVVTEEVVEETTPEVAETAVEEAAPEVVAEEPATEESPKKYVVVTPSNEFVNEYEDKALAESLIANYPHRGYRIR